MKKEEKLYDAITEIDDDLVEAAGKKRSSRRKFWYGLTAACLVLALCVGAVALGQESQDNTEAPGNYDQQGNQGTVRPVEREEAVGYALSQVNYPAVTPYPADPNADFEAYQRWAERRQARTRLQYRSEGMDQFLRDSMQAMLQGEENRVCSPLNVYMALAMLAEVTEGSSRQQILDALGADSIEGLRTQARNLWEANYSDDVVVTSRLAASIWLDDSVNFKQETLDTLANTYYAAAFRGTMGSVDFNAALQGWLNEQTGGLLEEQVGELAMDEQTVMALATTIYYCARWDDEFSQSATALGTFHAPEGDTDCVFLNDSSNAAYYWGENFSAVRRELAYSGSMWLILPDEDTELSALVQDSEVMDFILSGGDWENNTYLTVNLSVPKFDVASQLDLRETMQTLGITDVLDATSADFSPLTEDMDLVVSQALHGARVKIDEEGVEAAAYSVIAADGTGGFPEEEINFVLDRPFLFVITNEQGLPIFAGAVYAPV